MKLKNINWYKFAGLFIVYAVFSYQLNFLIGPTSGYLVSFAFFLISVEVER